MTEMAGIEKPILAGTPFESFDLWAPDKILVPDFRPLRAPGSGYRPPRYVPQPQPEGTARVVLGDDYYEHEHWSDYRDGSSESPEAVFDIPVEQRERWEAARDAYQAMQDEIREVMEARRRKPGPAQHGPYRPQP